MTRDEMAQAFGRHSDEYCEFNRIEHPLHPRPDLCAFLMLHDLVPGGGDIVAAAEHDEIFLSIDQDALAAVVTDDVIRDLTRCGVRLDEYGLCMFT